MNSEKQQLILDALARLEGNLQTIRSLVTNQEINKPQPKSASQKPKKQPKLQMAQSLPASELGPIPDYDDLDWPEAVNQHLIIDEDQDSVKKEFRAVQIIGLMGVPTKDCRILDCGCGDGYVAKELANNAAEVIGYDINTFQTWSKFSKPNLKFTTNKNDFGEQFDFIVIYDVLDHIEGESPEEFLTWVSKALKPNGRIFLRCHPWTSRHGGHLYTKINKAYLHLALTTDELTKLGFKLTPNLKINRPLATYDTIISKAGLSIESRKGFNDVVEPYFSKTLLDRIIKINWAGEIDHSTAIKIMSSQYIDYHLTNK